MRQFETLKMNLFDSTNACFRLDVEVKFVTSQQQGGRHLVYVTERGAGFLKPNVYLTISYREDNNNNSPVYTSYPQLFNLRQIFGKIKEYLLSGKAYVETDGVLAVNPEYAEPVIMNNIGKGNNWISLKLGVLESGENGVVTHAPGVAIQLSTANNKISSLTVDEFLTVCTIIEDLDLASIQFNASIAYLNAQSSMPAAVPYQQPAYQPYPQPAPQYYGNGQPQGGYYQQPAPRPQPRYGNQNYRGPAPRSNQGGYQQPAPAPQGQTYNPAPVASQEDTTMMRPRAQQANVAPQQNLQPRSQTPVMNLKAVEDTPVSEVNYDDTAAIDAIFDDE